ncbi:uncharacterized protein MAM_06983 [Metarhizium album ARSEF 1941]|uniref:Uncharacterized protein n=1 Tax=Metarhizium album (strain ARSEF 1941) TaxID=1081103 RepID=A0A0B2WMB9_METAS|nr:uncharacterized protein MAM_06983 [Metarhizium album ARSEF 1941]KHN95098.1 hypothetical protein MAM_06983 [Metarhizium album ARSEF 1941]
MPTTSTSILSRSAGCIRWECLTIAQRLGVALGAVVLFLVVSLVYMYSLGRACVANKERKSHGITKQGNTCGWSHGLPVSVSAQMSTAQNQLIAWQAVASHQLPNFTFPPPPVFYHGMPLVPSTYQQYPSQYSARYQQTNMAGGSAPPTRQPCRQTRHSCTAVRTRAESPEWLRRLNQTLPASTGKASTIQTDSGPESPVSVHHRQSASRRDTIDPSQCSRKKSQTKRERRRRGEEKTQDHGFEDPEAASIRSNAATVYSDDFQIIGPASSVKASQVCLG